jgi:hypothetical protein
MEAKLTRAGKHARILWSDGDQFGEVTFMWDTKTNKFIVDTEYLGIETLFKIINSITVDDNKTK